MTDLRKEAEELADTVMDIGYRFYEFAEGDPKNAVHLIEAALQKAKDDEIRDKKQKFLYLENNCNRLAIDNFEIKAKGDRLAAALEDMLYDVGCTDENCQMANHKEAQKVLKEWKGETLKEWILKGKEGE